MNTERPKLKPHRKSRVRYELTPEQQHEVSEAFELFDSDKTGQIDLHELKVMIKALGFPVKKPEVVKLVHSVDPSNEGMVDLKMVLDLMTDKYATLDPEEELKKVFSLFDDDNTGRISLKNMKRVARDLGEGLTEDELQSMLDEFDADQDGEIGLSEFIQIMSLNEA